MKRGFTKNSGIAGTVHSPLQAIKARIEEGKFKKPKCMSFGHSSNVRQKIAEGMADTEYTFVLIDYRNGNEQIKRIVMSHQECWQRNHTLSGTGLAWAKIER